MANLRKYQDLELHIRYRPFLRARAQAKFLNQDWSLSFEDFCSLWTINKWYCRGRGPKDLVMIRIDTEAEWSLTNCEIVTRREQLQRTARLKGNFHKEKQNGKKSVLSKD